MSENQYAMDLFQNKNGVDNWARMVADKDRNKYLIETYDLEFRRYFGIPLHRYHNLLMGFDVIAFDEQFIKSKDEESCAQAVERDYGPKAVALIRKLIGAKEDGSETS
jgi:hypothetical protein